MLPEPSGSRARCSFRGRLARLRQPSSPALAKRLRSGAEGTK
jgi:hypothetical protein